MLTIFAGHWRAVGLRRGGSSLLLALLLALLRCPVGEAASRETGSVLRDIDNAAGVWANLVQTGAHVERHRRLLDGTGRTRLQTLGRGSTKNEQGVTRKPRKLKASLAELGAAHRQRHGKQQPAEWFSGFSESESTYNSDGDAPGMDTGTRGWTPTNADSAGGGLDTAKPFVWFHETESGGPEEAWQTFYPAPEERGPISAPSWRESAFGDYYQHFSPAQLAGFKYTKEQRPAGWFDTSVEHLDEFGRPRQPLPGSVGRNVGWQQVSSNVSVKCATPGCIANGSLRVPFNHSEDEHRNCVLSIVVHATDYDDEFSREHVEYWMIQNRTLVTRCNPQVKGCTPKEQEQEYPCVTDFDIDPMLRGESSLKVEGKITGMVDECAKEDGSLLSGIATMRCFVRKRPAPLGAHRRPTGRNSLESRTSGSQRLSHSQRFGCKTPGCIAGTRLFTDPQGLLGKTCNLTVKIAQTDFDGDLGMQEELEWLRVENETVKEHVKPGKNGCKLSLATGNGTAADEMEFTVVRDHNVTEQALSGIITVTSKISAMVDECGSNGLLLDAVATLTCA